MSEVKTEVSEDSFLSEVTVESVGSVLRQCSNRQSNNGQTTNAFSMRQKKKLTPKQLADLKLESQCKKCQKWGHWKKTTTKMDH